MNLNELTIQEAHDKLQSGDIFATELSQVCLRRIEQVDPQINAFLRVTGEQALAAAEKVDEKIRRGKKLGPLEGIPVALKDNLSAKGVITSSASRTLQNYVPPYDATVVQKLKKAGAIMLGKTNMDEFAMGSSTENSAFQITHNPWNLGCVPGGSSGGSAAAVASDECIYALGSDTGGSVRQPAALCGVVGLKPTYGRVSRYGLHAMASSLDQIGPFAKTVEDCAYVLNIISGHDSRDSTSGTNAMPDYTETLTRGLHNLKIGVPQEYAGEGMEEGVAEQINNAVEQLKELGAKVRKVSLPHTKYALAVYYILMPAEVSANLARFDGIRYGYAAKEAKNLEEHYFNSRAESFGSEVRRRIMLGAYVLSAGYYDAYYKKAQQVRTLVINDFKQVFRKVDALVTPVSPTPAFKIGEKASDPLSMYLSDVFTVPVNIAGVPAISIPCGFSHNLPVGLQIIGPWWGEEQVLQVAYQYEQATDWHKKKPNI
ncbi:MAG: Asp-tRNA(Asn)/Glu-tRNA(Gln) amidotransferase subunit GatA [Patescibacteria group bacterium]|nr:Asp-tRNA(Asn)/Glu-tRNA(Gln) amidotransferase subunit GatA [Patescibacteria group bacterium]